MKIALLIALSLFLCGCSKQEDTAIITTGFKLPFIDGTFAEVPVEQDAVLVSTDGLSKWSFSNGLELEIFSKTAGGITVGNYTLEARGNSVNEDVIHQSNVKPVAKEVSFPTSNRVGKLPDMKEVDTVLTPKGVYMPPDYVISKNAYTAEVWSNGTSFVHIYVLKGLVEDVKQSLGTRLDGQFSWYEDASRILVYTNTHVYGAIKQTENKWVMCGATKDMADYVLCNMQEVKEIE